jgi:hypothetical protein
MTNLDNTEETDIVLDQMQRERREREKRKMEEATIIMLQNELDSYAYPPDDEAYRYDLGGDEWIDSINGADTWYRENQHRMPKRQTWKNGAD